MNSFTSSPLFSAPLLVFLLSGCASPDDAVRIGHQEVDASAEFSVVTQIGDESPSQLSFQAEIRNDSLEAASDLSFWYYGDEQGHAPLSAAVDWSSSPVSVTKVALASGKTAWVFRAESPVPAHTSVHLDVRLHSSDWTPVNFADDYSYQGLLSSNAENLYVGLYQSEQLISGTANDADLDVPLPDSNLNQLKVSAQILSQFENQLALKVKVHNTGANNVGQIEAGYLLTPEGQSTTQVAIDWSSCAVTASVDEPSSESERIALDFGTTVLVPDAFCELDLRIFQADWSAMNFLNDPSYEGLSTTESEQPAIAAYVDGVQVFGYGVGDARWVSLASSADFPGYNASYADPVFAVAPDGIRYVYYRSLDGLPEVYAHDGTTWNPIAVAGLETLSARAEFGFIGNSPVLYDAAEVRQFDASSWTLLARPGDVGTTLASQVTIAPQGEVYTAVSVGAAIQLYQATPESGFVALGLPLVGSLATANANALTASPNGELYLAWTEYGNASGELFVSRFDDGSWTQLIDEGVTFGYFGAYTRELFVSSTEEVTLEVGLGGLRSAFYHSYRVDNGALDLFSWWGIGPNSMPCRHPVSLFADDSGKVYRSSNFVEEGLNNFYLETFDFSSRAWTLVNAPLHNAVFQRQDNYNCRQTLDAASTGELSVMSEDGSVSTFLPAAL